MTVWHSNHEFEWNALFNEDEKRTENELQVTPPEANYWGPANLVGLSGKPIQEIEIY